MPDEQPWKCATCRDVLTEVDGYILVFNANPDLGPVGNYPKAGTPEPVLPRGDGAFGAAISAGQMAALPEIPDNIGFLATCARCDPYTARSPYTIGRVPTSAVAWMAWVAHLGEKRWMGAHDLA